MALPSLTLSELAELASRFRRGSIQPFVVRGSAVSGDLLTTDSSGNAVWQTPGSTSIPPATASTLGAVQMSVAPVTAGTPIAVGDNDARMTNARTPTAHTHPLSDLLQSGASNYQVVRWDTASGAYVPRLLDSNSFLATAIDGTSGTASLRTLGTGAAQAVAGNDARIPTQPENDALVGTSGTPSTSNKYVTDADTRNTNARTPTAHAASHATGGTDPLTIPESQVTNLVADLAAKASLASPVFTGDPQAPTPAAGDSDASVATTLFVQAAVGSMSSARPSVKAYATGGNQTVGTSWNTLAMAGESFDTDSMHDTVTNNSRLTFRTPGKYVVSGNIAFAQNSAAIVIGARIVKNGATILAENYRTVPSRSPSTDNDLLPISQVIDVAANDYIEIQGYCSLSHNMQPMGELANYLSAAWVGGSGAAWGNAGAQAYGDAAQSTSGTPTTWTTLPLNNETFDVDGEHDTVTNNSRITCVTAGKYIFVGNISLTSTTAADDGRGIRLLKNGTVIFGSSYTAKPATTGTPTMHFNVAGIVDLVPGDYVELQAISALATQAVGAATTNGLYQRSLSALRVGYSDSTRPNLVTALPASPQNGDEIHFQVDATNGIIWRFRYNSTSASAYKWEFVGGPPLWAEVAAGVVNTSTTYAALASSAGPVITLPALAGDFIVETAALVGASAAGNGWMSYDIGAAAAVDTDAAEFLAPSGTIGQAYRKKLKTALAASTVLTAKYKGSASGPSFAYRMMSVTPVRVG